jgi:hypothetical protein
VRKPWTPAQVRKLLALYPNMLTVKVARLLRMKLRRVYQKASGLGLKKSAAFMASDASGRLTKLTAKGRVHRFPRGHRPWNAGLKGWQAGGRARLTQFKKGNYSKRWDREIYRVGALRITRDRLEIKVREGLRSWEGLARFVWMTERGPIPRGRMVRAINGDPDDTRIENLRLGDRVELMNENTYHRYPKEIANLIQLRGALNRQINKREGRA